MSAIELFDNRPAPAMERLARIEGQSNFISLLAGIEAGKDTTQDVAALAFARTKGCIPEVLEAHVAKSLLFKLPLMSLVFKAISEVLEPGEKDISWIQGAVADAFFLLRDGYCNSIKERAKRFRVNESAYAAARSLANGVFNSLLDQAIRKWHQSLARETPSYRQDVSTERSNTIDGHYCKPVLRPEGSNSMGGYEAKAVGINDRLGWDEREACKPAPVKFEPVQRTPSAQTKSDTEMDEP